MKEEATKWAEKQVYTEIFKIATKLGYLENNLQSLEERLETVLTPFLKDAGDPAAEAPALVPLAERLREFYWRICNLNSRFEEIFDRLEL
jgi:hypothetical protein